ncbi:hypothetical protein ACFX1Q_035971 [Malus domestica]
MIETLNTAPMINALVAQSPKPSTFQSQSQSGRPYPSYNTNPGYKSFTNKNKGIFNSTTRFNNSKPFFNNGNFGSGILGLAPQFGTTPLIPCQICGKTNHLVDTCRFQSSQGCQICGKPNHMAITCRFRNVAQSNGCQICGNPNHSAEFYFQKGSSSPMTAMYVNHKSDNSTAPPLPFALPQQVWITDTGATNHMTTDLSNLSLATPYHSHESIQIANGAALPISHIGHSTLHTPLQSFQLKSVLYVLKLTQNLLSVHRICLDNNCWLIFDAFCFWI